MYRDANMTAMSILPSAPEDAAHADEAPDPAVLRAERRLRLLAELAEIGMELARALKPSPPADEGEAPDAAADEARGRRRDPAEAFAGLSRAIRLTLMLEATADEELRNLSSGVVTERKEKRARAAVKAREADDERRQVREADIHDLVTEVAMDQITGEADLERFDRELSDRLLFDDDFWSDPARPLREIVERYCDYFDLAPDWSRWQGDGWAPEAPPVWPWAARSDPPRAPPLAEPTLWTEAPARGPP